MASLGIRYGGNHAVFDQKPNPSSRLVSNRRSRTRIPMSKMTTLPTVETSVKGRRRRGGNEVISRDKLDQWMNESVVDIVKNLREAPLFLRFYTSDDGEAARFETEKAVTEERWPILEDQWESGTCRVPEGVMIVQELEDDDDDHDGSGGDGGGEGKAWGIVVQGRGKERGTPVCYLLKTSSSAAAAGVGVWCTHFCLVRVKNFRETTKSQLQNCWLLQNQ